MNELPPELGCPCVTFQETAALTYLLVCPGLGEGREEGGAADGPLSWGAGGWGEPAAPSSAGSEQPHCGEAEPVSLRDLGNRRLTSLLLPPLLLPKN